MKRSETLNPAGRGSRADTYWREKTRDRCSTGTDMIVSGLILGASVAAIVTGAIVS